MTDIATALDHVLGDPKTESKFQALKVLHAKKIKSLMGSIDSQQKEIGKLKTLSKDNRRTQIIQSLKKKIRELELVCDVLKEEFEKKLEWSREEVNDFVIRKTISGPKRFRPLTREELENQIAELEKRSKSNHAISSNPPPASTTNGRKRSSQQLPSASGTNRSGSESNRDFEDPAVMLKISQLQEKVTSAQHDCDRKDEVIATLRQEVSRLRTLTSQLRAGEEERDMTERQLNDLRARHERTIEELEEALQKVSTTEEECFQIQAQSQLELEQQSLELEILRDQCEKGLKQNTSLLRRLTELEASRVAPLAQTATTSDSPPRQSQLQEKLRIANARIATLEALPKTSDAEHLATIDNLKTTLREKNETIRELKRNITELSRVSRSRVGHKGDGQTDNGQSGNHSSDIAESKVSGKDDIGSKSAKQSRDMGMVGNHVEVVKLADQLVEYELHMLRKTDSRHRIPIDEELVSTVNSLLVALNGVVNLQKRVKKDWGGDTRLALHPNKLQTFEHQMLLRYDMPGVGIVDNDEDEESLKGEFF